MKLYWLCFSVGYYSTWLWNQTTILSCGAIPQYLRRSLIKSLPIGGEILWLCFFNQSTVLTVRCNGTYVGLPAGLFKSILVDTNLPITCWHSWSFTEVLIASKTKNFNLKYRFQSCSNEVASSSTHYHFFVDSELPRVQDQGALMWAIITWQVEHTLYSVAQFSKGGEIVRKLFLIHPSVFTEGATEQI